MGPAGLAPVDGVNPDGLGSAFGEREAGVIGGRTAAGVGVSAGSPSGFSSGSGRCQVFLASSQPWYRWKVHIPKSAPVSIAEMILKKSPCRTKVFTAVVETRISHSGTRILRSFR
jgi:hypothetical protein